LLILVEIAEDTTLVNTLAIIVPNKYIKYIQLVEKKRERCGGIKSSKCKQFRQLSMKLSQESPIPPGLQQRVIRGWNHIPPNGSAANIGHACPFVENPQGLNLVYKAELSAWSDVKDSDKTSYGSSAQVPGPVK
jgi:hypothetical protein